MQNRIFKTLKSYIDMSSPLYEVRLTIFAAIFLSLFALLISISQNLLSFEVFSYISMIYALYAFVRYRATSNSIKTPDFAFNYGYGKYESLFLPISTVLMLAVLVYASYSAYYLINQDRSEIINNYWAILSSIAIFIVYWLMKRIRHIAEKQNKLVVLEYFGIFSDSFVIAQFGLILTQIVINILVVLSYNYLVIYADIIGSLLIISYMLLLPIKEFRPSIDKLLDKTVDDDISFHLLAAVVEHIQDICEFRALHTRKSGKDLFVEIDVVLPPNFTIEQKSKIEEKICEKIKLLYPNSIPRLYAIPCNDKCNEAGSKKKCSLKLNNSDSKS